MSYEHIFQGIIDPTSATQARVHVFSAHKLRPGVMRSRRSASPPPFRSASPLTPKPAFASGEAAERPLLLIHAGTIYAPFQNLLERRLVAHDEGRAIGQVVLFTGCERANLDVLPSANLDALEGAEVLKIFAATSAPSREDRTIPHRLWRERERIAALLCHEVDIHVCGDGRFMVPAVRNILQRIYADATLTCKRGTDRWWATCAEGDGPVRYFEDAWPGRVRPQPFFTA